MAIGLLIVFLALFAGCGDQHDDLDLSTAAEVEQRGPDAARVTAENRLLIAELAQIRAANERIEKRLARIEEGLAASGPRSSGEAETLAKELAEVRQALSQRAGVARVWLPTGSDWRKKADDLREQRCNWSTTHQHTPTSTRGELMRQWKIDLQCLLLTRADVLELWGRPSAVHDNGKAWDYREETEQLRLRGVFRRIRVCYEGSYVVDIRHDEEKLR